MTPPSGLRHDIDVQLARLTILRRGFWFVAIPRTSSSSIHAELGQRFGRAYGKRNVDAGHGTDQVFLDHLPARRMRRQLGSRLWDRIFTFSVVRDPWDRTHSLYHHRRKVGSIPESWTFREYVLALEHATGDTPHFRYHGHRYGAAEYLTDARGHVIVDHIVRFERRAEGLAQVAARVPALRDVGQLRIQQAAPTGSRYADAYDEETAAIIQRRYARDIELFGYTFDGPPPGD